MDIEEDVRVVVVAGKVVSFCLIEISQVSLGTPSAWKIINSGLVGSSLTLFEFFSFKKI